MSVLPGRKSVVDFCLGFVLGGIAGFFAGKKVGNGKRKHRKTTEVEHGSKEE